MIDTFSEPLETKPMIAKIPLSKRRGTFLQRTVKMAATLALLALPPSALRADTMFGNNSDADVRKDGLVQSVTGTAFSAGGSGSPAQDRSGVFVFQLPNLGPLPNPFTAATLNFNLVSKTTNTKNTDLYGLGKRSASTVLGTDYYGESTTPDPTDATLLQDNILANNSVVGLKQTSVTGDAALLTYLNTQYDSGAGAGQYIFLRLSSDTAVTTIVRYYVTSADGGAVGPPDTRPQITYTANTTPPTDTLGVETAADGTGTVVPAQDLVSGNSITVHAVSRNAGVFVDNPVANWSLASTGSVVAGNLVVEPGGKSATFTAAGTGTAIIQVTGNAVATVPSGVITVVAGAATQVRVETSGDGSGTVLPAQSLNTVGDTATPYAITRDAAGNFVANVAATWSLANITGNVVGADLVPEGDNKSATLTAAQNGAANIRAAVGGLTSVDSGLISVFRILTWSGLGADWNTVNNTHWLLQDLATQTAFVPGDDVVFDDNGLANPVVNLVGGLSPHKITVTGTTDYTLGGAGKITGTGALDHNSSGILTVQTSNDHSGPTTATSGTLILSGDNSTAASATTVASGATLQVGANNNFTAGTLRLNGAASAASLNLINNNTTSFTKDVLLGGGSNSFYQIHVNNAGTGTGLNHTIGSLSQASAGIRTLTINGGNDYGLVIENLNLPPLTGQTTTLVADTRVILNDVTNPMSGFGPTNYDTLALSGSFTDNVVAGSIEDAAGGNQTLGGTTRVTKTGTGTWTLAGTNAYTGVTTINDGILKAGSAAALPGLGTLSMSASGTLDLNGFDAGFTALSASAVTNTITNSNASLKTLTLSSNGNVVINALVTGPLSVKVANANPAAVLFNPADANTFSGGLTLLNGTVNGTRCRISASIITDGTPGAINSSPFGTGAITIGTVATDKAGMLFDTVANNTLVNDVVFNTALGTDVPGIRFDTLGNTLSGTITAALADATFSAGPAAVSSVSLTGKITGQAGLALTPPPNATTSALTVILHNTSATNDYPGDTTISKIASSNYTLTLEASDQIPNGIGKGNVTVDGSLHLNGFSETINGLNGAGTGVIDGISGTPGITFGDNDANGTYAGVIKNTAGSLAITKIGGGTVTLSGVNTYSGKTKVLGGVLAVNNTSLPGSTQLTIDGGKLQPAGSVTVDTLFFGGVQQASGIWGGPDSPATNKDGNRFSGTGIVFVTSGPGNAYDTFVSVIDNPADRDPADDPDFDGIANAVEFVIGGNPATASDSALLPTQSMVTTDLGAGSTSYFKFTFRRTDTSAYLAPGAEYNTDLANAWSPAENGQLGVVVQVADDAFGTGVDRVDVYLPTGLSAGGKLFSRMKGSVP